MRKTIRFFAILALGVAWPFLVGLVLMPFLPMGDGRYMPDRMPFAHSAFLPFAFLKWACSIPIAFALFGLSFIVLAYVSILRERLGYAFWCAAVPTGVLMSWLYAAFLTTPTGGDGMGADALGMAAYGVAIAGIAIVCACAGGVIQWIRGRWKKKAASPIGCDSPG
jgi:hypothetical protein